MGVELFNFLSKKKNVVIVRGRFFIFFLEEKLIMCIGLDFKIIIRLWLCVSWIIKYVDERFFFLYIFF